MAEKLFDVHLYAVYRIKMCNVLGEDAADARKRAIEAAKPEQFDVYYYKNRESVPATYRMVIEYKEFADEITNTLVDEVGDEEYAHSAAFDADGNPTSEYPTGTDLLERIRMLEHRVQELLEANNREVERRREAEANLKSLAMIVNMVAQGVR